MREEEKKELGRIVKDSVDEAFGQMAPYFERQEEKLDQVTDDVSVIKVRMDNVEKRLDNVDDKLGRIEKKLDSHGQRIERVEEKVGIESK